MSLDRPAKPPDRPDPQPAADPPEPSGDPWGVESLTRAQAFESLRAQTAPTDTAPLTDHPRNYWAEVSHFRDMASRLADRWPGMRYHESGDSREYDVLPEKRSEVVQEVARITEGEPPVSDSLRAAAEQSPHGGHLAGFEYRCKGGDRLTEKALSGLEAQPDASAAEVVRRIPDAIRYTICFETGQYVEGYRDMKERLESSGFEMYYSKNSWTNPEYKGINTRWVTAEGQRFEVQFHTPESFHAKHEVTHQAYERLRGTQAARAERTELRAFQREVSSWIPVPDRVTGIPDYKKKGF